MKQLKYAWDIVIERELSEKQMNCVDEVSQMISCGGEISEIKEKLEQINKS